MPRVCASLRSRIAHGHVTRPVLHENLQKKWWSPRCDAEFVRACAVETHGKMPGPKIKKKSPRRLCASLQSKCTWTCDKTKSNFMRVFTEKCRSPRSRRKVCASCRNPNAHGHVTRAVLGEFTGKRPAQDRVSEFM